MERVRVAPWPASVWLISAASTTGAFAVFLGIGPALAAAGIPRGAALLASAAPFAVVCVAALFAVRGYRLGPQGLQVERLLWSFAVPLDGVTDAWPDPSVLVSAKRVLGIAGLFSWSCRCRSRSLGSFRIWGTDPSRAVVLFRREGSIVVTPESPEAFLAQLRGALPHVVVRPGPVAAR